MRDWVSSIFLTIVIYVNLLLVLTIDIYVNLLLVELSNKNEYNRTEDKLSNQLNCPNQNKKQMSQIV